MLVFTILKLCPLDEQWDACCTFTNFEKAKAYIKFICDGSVTEDGWEGKTKSGIHLVIDENVMDPTDWEEGGTVSAFSWDTASHQFKKVL